MTETLRALVVDDDEMYRSFIVRSLKRLGFSLIETASNYVDAAVLMERHAYNLIVSDNNMPPLKKAGLALLADVRLSELNQNTPFVLHTGDEREEVQREVEIKGGYLLQKPGGNVDEFLRSVLEEEKERAKIR